MPQHQDNRIIASHDGWHVLAQRCEIMFRDGTVVYLHPVLQGDATMPMHRAVHHEGMRWLVLDLRHHSAHVQDFLQSAPARDAPGIVFYAMRNIYPTARAFTDRLALTHVHAWWQAPSAEAA